MQASSWIIAQQLFLITKGEKKKKNLMVSSLQDYLTLQKEYGVHSTATKPIQRRLHKDTHSPLIKL